MLVLALFVAGLCLQPITETDVFFRLKVGQLIAGEHALPRLNRLSFTYPNHPELDPAWLFELALAALYRVGGFAAIVVGKTAIVLAAFVGAYVVARRRGAGPLAATLALAGAALVMRERLVERPHVVSFVGEVMVLAVIARARAPLSGRGVAAFAVGMVLWSNAHAGVFAAVSLLGLASAGVLATDRARARRLAVLAGVAVLAASLTPIGPLGLARYLILHVTLPALHTVDEFRAATWRSDASYFIGLAVAVAVTAAAVLRSRRRALSAALVGPPLSAGSNGAAGSNRTPVSAGPRAFLLAHANQLAPAVGFAILGLASVRFAADAALILAVWVAVALGAAPRPSRTARVAVALGLVAATLVPRVAAARAGGRAFDLSVDLGGMPQSALRFVEQHGLRERMYNDFEVGSYLAFEGFPRYRVFVDPRLPAYPAEFHRLLGRFDVSRAEWTAAMERYGVDTALLAYAGLNRRVSWWAPADWALVFRADDARVFVRRTPRWRALIAKQEIPVTFSFTVEAGTATHLLEQRPAASPVADCEWQRRLGDLAFELAPTEPERVRTYYDRALATPGCLPAKEEASLLAYLGGEALERRAFARANQLLESRVDAGPGRRPRARVAGRRAGGARSSVGGAGRLGRGRARRRGHGGGRGRRPARVRAARARRCALAPTERLPPARAAVPASAPVARTGWAARAAGRRGPAWRTPPR